ncbi:MAG: DUF4136 domain-containing protein [Marinobacter sp.]|uniref:DUF4136 domain-containing protein n=1 Tax=Marinobacter sp. TaxID=50741 RepID=UPI00299F251B|nr:DUF4136 domain-containing protein [Marinobacter sp.]MDX1756555.1 DUF4136 domain-containing protein [Marinobacter sp.]
MRIPALLLALSLLAGCASKVVTDYDAAASFENYQTWAFAPGLQAQGFTSLDSARVKNAVTREMAAKQLRSVSSEQADLLVAYQVVEEERLQSYGFSYGLGFGHRPFGWGIASAPPVREVKEGKLVVELVDRASEKVVWRAASRRYLTEDQSPEYRSELIDELVTEMFNRFPPETR